MNKVKLMMDGQADRSDVATCSIIRTRGRNQKGMEHRAPLPFFMLDATLRSSAPSRLPYEATPLPQEPVILLLLPLFNQLVKMEEQRFFKTSHLSMLHTACDDSSMPISSSLRLALIDVILIFIAMAVFFFSTSNYIVF